MIDPAAVAPIPRNLRLSEAPALLVIAGPNGSGKSTLIDHIRDQGIALGTYINADEIAATLDGHDPELSRRAQAVADSKRERCLASREHFSFETVMSHPSKVAFMLRAHDLGYEITLYFVCTSDPNINLMRVANRVALGGHDVPPERVVARYWRSLDLLCGAALVAGRTVLFDNSALLNETQPGQPGEFNSPAGLRPVAELLRTGESDYLLNIEPFPPSWVFEHFVKSLEAVVAVSEGAIGLTVRDTADSGH